MRRYAWLCLVFAGTLLLSTSAHASRAVNSVFLSYGSQANVTSITVPPSAGITTDVTVAHLTGGGNTRWRATSYRIGAGATVCIDHADFDATGTDSVTFTMTAPAAAGNYNVAVIAYADSACTNSPSATFTLTNGIVVSTADTSSVTANPASVAADGITTSLITVTLLDSGGAPRVGKVVTLTALSGSSIVSAASGTSSAAGVVTFTVRDAVAETVTYRARNATDNITVLQTAAVTFTAVPAIASFNVIEAAEPANGRIYTKIAGTLFGALPAASLHIVALRSNGTVNTAFIGTVAVDVVDATGTACTNPAVAGIQAFPNQTFGIGENGRHPITTSIAVGNVYRQARVRVKYPAVAPTIVSCSTDVFAIRPDTLSIAVSSASAASLTNTAIPGTGIHKAGAPFTITVRGLDSAGNPVSLYDGAPVAALPFACVGAACTATFGALAIGAWTASGGTLTASASYSDVGAFALQLDDTSFAAADAGDPTSASARTATGTASVGRFVPDRFIVSGPSITPRAAIAACAASTFTYLGERMDAAFTLTAVNASGAPTSRYAGALARLDLSTFASFGFAAIDPAGPTQLTSRIAAVPGGPALTWSAGAANVTARLLISRNAAGSRDGPFHGVAMSGVRIGIAPVDPDGVAVAPPAFDLDADGNTTLDHVQIGTMLLRFGQMRLTNGHGSAATLIPLRLETQYWNGTAFVKNTDDSCTPVAASNVALGNYQKNLGPGETTVTVSAARVSSGEAWLRLSAPGASNNGSVNVSVNLTSGAAGQSCTAGMGASTGASLSYLQGAWCGAASTRDPTARATFGVYRSASTLVYQRENY